MTHHTVLPPSGGFRPASTRFWHARRWQLQRPILLFLCCCFERKARMVIWKHKNTDTLTLLGKTMVGAKGSRRGLCLPSFPMERCLGEKHRRGVAREMLLAPQHLPPLSTPTARLCLCCTGAERCSCWSQA